MRALARLISPEEIFRLHPKIRWTALSALDGRVAFCEMRPGLKSYTSDAEDRSFMEFGPPLMAGIAERLSPTGGAGRLQSLIVNLEKDSVFLTQLGNAYLAISANRSDAPDVFRKIEPLIGRLILCDENGGPRK